MGHSGGTARGIGLRDGEWGMGCRMGMEGRTAWAMGYRMGYGMGNVVMGW